MWHFLSLPRISLPYEIYSVLFGRAPAALIQKFEFLQKGIAVRADTLLAVKGGFKQPAACVHGGKYAHPDPGYYTFLRG